MFPAIGAIGAIGASFILSDSLEATIIAYEQIAESGAATFGGLVQWPVIGWVVKYVYAILAPFPWSEAPLFIDWNYGGNTLLFLMHVLSALSGLYLFLVMIIKYRLIIDSDVGLKKMIIYGLIMSLSILKGSTGFHTYLLIYFPFLAPLFGIKQFRINPMLLIGIISILEFILILKKI